MEKDYANVRTITVVTEPEPEGPIIKLGIGEKELVNVVRIHPNDVVRIRVSEETTGKYEADFELTEKMGIHGKFSFVPKSPMKCKLSDRTLSCEIKEGDAKKYREYPEALREAI